MKDHHQEWIEASKGGRPTLCNFADFASEITEVMLVGALAQRLGRSIEWDAGKMEATNCLQAAGFVKRAYRRGWEIQ